MWSTPMPRGLPPSLDSIAKSRPKQGSDDSAPAPNACAWMVLRYKVAVQRSRCSSPEGPDRAYIYIHMVWTAGAREGLQTRACGFLGLRTSARLRRLKLKDSHNLTKGVNRNSEVPAPRSDPSVRSSAVRKGTQSLAFQVLFLLTYRPVL